jgi:hypothetical protein
MTDTMFVKQYHLFVACLIFRKKCRRAVSLLPRIDQLWYKYMHKHAMHG